MEMKSMKKQFLVLLIVLSLAILEPAKATELATWHIHIVNGLSNGQMLSVQCKSKDNDLGAHSVSVGAEFDWSFSVDISYKEFFYLCNLEKPNLQSISLVAFSVESAPGWLHDHCFENNCIWTAKDDGIYLKDIKGNKDDFIKNWL